MQRRAHGVADGHLVLPSGTFSGKKRENALSTSQCSQCAQRCQERRKPPAKKVELNFQKRLAFFVDVGYNSIRSLRQGFLRRNGTDADVAQQVERVLGKDEVTGSNPVSSSKENHQIWWFFII